MEESKKKKYKKISYFAKWGIAVAVVILICVAVAMLFGERETHESTAEDSPAVGYLYCNADNLEEALFVSPEAKFVKHEIKITISNNKTDKLFYTFTAVQENEAKAESELTNQRVLYNKKVGSKKIEPAFYKNDNEIRVTAYAEKKEIDGTISPVFLLNQSEAENFGNYSAKDLKRMYEAKGLKCVINN